LARALEGDLDWITMRALEKDRDDRYSSPLDLLAEIDRHLRNEPVMAGPPSGIYRARKFFRRHRIGVLAATFCIAAMIAGLGLATVGFLRAKSSEREAIAQAESARRVSGVLEEIFNVMNPGSQAGQVLAARDVLQHGADRIDDSLHDQPVVRAHLMATIGGVGANLGYFEMADPLLVEALAVQRELLGNDHPEVGRTLFTIGWLAFWQGDLHRSLDSFEEASKILEKAASPTDQLPLTARTAAGFLMNLVGDIEGSREALDEALEASEATFGPDSAAVSDVLLFSGDLHFDAGRFEEAGREWERAVAIRRAVFGAEHQQYAFAISDFARYFRVTGQLEEAKRLADSAIEIFERTYGPDHPALAGALGSQGTTLRSMEDYEGAIQHYERAASILRNLFGPDHARLSWITRGLAGVYLRMDEFAEAAAIAREALRISETAYGKEHIECARSHSLIGYVEYKLERYPESRHSYETSLAIRIKVLPANHRGLITVCYNLACIFALEGEQGRALEMLQMSLDAGFANLLISDDPDLDILRGDPEFEEMAREVRRRQPE